MHEEELQSTRTHTAFWSTCLHVTRKHAAGTFVVDMARTHMGEREMTEKAVAFSL